MAVDARRELVQIAKLRPAAAPLWRPAGRHMAEPVELYEGCWFLRPSGLCAIEVDLGRAAKPAVCRLFPFNRLSAVEGVLVIDVNARLCPLHDAGGTGVAWNEIARDLDGEVARDLAAPMKMPAGARELGWLDAETFVRDGIAEHLDQPDYAAFAAFQEELVIALAQGREPPPPGAPEVLARAERLRSLLRRWRAIFGIAERAGAARIAARQSALLTSSWRMHWLLRDGAAPYATELQRMPRQLLVSALLVELGVQAQERGPSLRAAMQTRLATLPLATLLGLSEHRARLGKPPQMAVAPAEVTSALASLSDSLRRAKKPLLATLEEALSACEPHVRGLALVWLADAGPQLELL